MTTLLFVLSAMGFLVVVEVLKRVLRLSTDVSRRIAHVGAGAINLVAPVYLSDQAIILSNAAFAGLLLWCRGTPYLSSIHHVARKTYGDVYFPLGVIVAAIVLLPDHVLAFQFGVAVMGISDALAGLVGERWGRTAVLLWGNRKTIEGACAFCLSTACIAYVCGADGTFAVAAVALLLTGIEFVLVFGLDNIVLPLAAGYLYLLFL